jgi:hypothetical protein
VDLSAEEAEEGMNNRHRYLHKYTEAFDFFSELYPRQQGGI